MQEEYHHQAGIGVLTPQGWEWVGFVLLRILVRSLLTPSVLTLLGLVDELVTPDYLDGTL